MQIKIDGTGNNKLIEGRSGLFIANKYDIYIGRSLIKYGEFSWHEFEFMQQMVRTGDVVVEVGANIGTHTIGLAKLVGDQGRVIACEPQPVVFQTLCANVLINNLDTVDCIPYAIGAENGTFLYPRLNYATKNNFGGLSLEAMQKIGAENGILVHIKPLDQFFTFKRLDLLKIDVEGMEEGVLRGAMQTIERFRPKIYLENDRIEKSANLIKLLWELNYTLWWHLPPLFNADNYFKDPENIFGAIVSVNMLALPKEIPARISGLQQIEDATFHPAHAWRQK